MSAYWMTTYTAVNDPDKVAAYAELAGPALRALGDGADRDMRIVPGA